MDLPNTRLWRDDPRPMASPPLIVVPTDIKPAVVLEAVKVWPGKAEYAARLGRRPTLTAPARAGFAILRVGAKNGIPRRTKKLIESARNRLTIKAPYKACSAFTRVTACTLALPPYIVARYPKASATSLPP